jgi:hypothetical protein
MLHRPLCSMVLIIFNYITLSPLGRVIVSGPAPFRASWGLLLLPLALLPFAVLLPGAAARPEPAMPLAEGAALLFLPMLLRVHLVQALGPSSRQNSYANTVEPAPFNPRLTCRSL